MLLDSTSSSLEIELSAAATTAWTVEWVDKATGGYTPGTARGSAGSSGTVAVVSAPGASTQRRIVRMSLVNRHSTTTQTVSVKTDVSATDYYDTPAFLLRPGEGVVYDGQRWTSLGSDGRPQEASRATAYTGSGYSLPVHKVGTTAEAVGVWHCLYAATGNPGVWAPGTPGLNGRTTDGTTLTDAGCLPITTPASGSNYLVGWQASTSVIAGLWLIDVMWVNSGLVPTTLTAQAITSPTWPARDARGLTEGHGVMVGILVTTVTTNASPVTNMTMSYTNQAGTPGHTATIASFPATAVAGTVVWFQLAAGDTGVRSVQSVTLGTSLGATGVVSVIAARWVASAGSLVVNVPALAPLRGTDAGGAGIVLYAGSCLLLAYIATATTALSAFGLATIEVR